MEGRLDASRVSPRLRIRTSRALVAIFTVDELTERLAFRGGTALHKLHLAPAARYSEDIDLVQTRPEPIGETLDALRGALDPWLGTPGRKVSEGRVTLTYRFDSEDSPPIRLRLKVEINSRERGGTSELLRALCAPRGGASRFHNVQLTGARGSGRYAQ